MEKQRGAEIVPINDHLHRRKSPRLRFWLEDLVDIVAQDEKGKTWVSIEGREWKTKTDNLPYYCRYPGTLLFGVQYPEMELVAIERKAGVLSRATGKKFTVFRKAFMPSSPDALPWVKPARRRIGSS